ncbi:MAG TPA: AsmA-like C-terminal region-containing protein, partial [Gammaproteobacteria bacterium]|nr:AsmA-like C-terminal region-containing protein [Gammaproteobacteria bacterium]
AQGLSGPLQVQINQGIIEGLDLEYYLESARALLKKEQRPKNDRKRTSFTTLKGTFLANHNYLTNNDLRLDADNLYALGDGSIDLNQKYLEYKFLVHKIYHDGKQHPNALPLAVRVKGPFNDIKIMPDIDAYLKTVVKKEAQEELEEQLNKHLDKILRKEKTPESNGSPPPTEDNASPESVEDKIEEEIDKGLKKLFKF